MSAGRNEGGGGRKTITTTTEREAIATDRKKLALIIKTLPEEKVAIAINLMQQLRADSDKFYSESNMRHLRVIKSDAQAGINMSVHDLIEAGDD